LGRPMMATIGFMQFVFGFQCLVLNALIFKHLIRSQLTKMQATNRIGACPARGHPEPGQFSIDRSSNNSYEFWRLISLDDPQFH
jgi:hypothetical protein